MSIVSILFTSIKSALFYYFSYTTTYIRIRYCMQFFSFSFFPAGCRGDDVLSGFDGINMTNHTAVFFLNISKYTRLIFGTYYS